MASTYCKEGAFKVEKREMTEFDEVMDILKNKSAEIESVEEVGLLDAVGRVIGRDIISDYDFPPFNRSAMDGFAFRYEDVEATENPVLKVKGSVLAGHPGDEDVKLKAGECVRIMTGGSVPKFCDTVAEFEICEEKNGVVKLLKIPKKFANIAIKGEDLKKGELALKKGQLIEPKTINLAGSLGLKKIPVKRKLKIGVISTGDELVDVDEEIKDGKIRNSSKYSLGAQINAIHQEFVDLGMVKDNENEIHKAIEKGLNLDILLITGGSSVGDKDLTLKVLNQFHADVMVKRVAMKPGKPTVIATINRDGKDVWVFGMPGNPVSTFSVFRLLVTYLVEQLLGTSGLYPTVFNGTLKFNFKKKIDRMHFVPCKVKVGDGHLEIDRVRYNGSGDFTALSKANGFFIAPKEIEKLSEGSVVKCFFI